MVPTAKDPTSEPFTSIKARTIAVPADRIPIVREGGMDSHKIQLKLPSFALGFGRFVWHSK